MDPLVFEERLKAVPTDAGVYLMRDAAGKVIYVGKAISLRNRLRSYFGSPRGHTPKTRQLVDQIADFEFIVTDTELEALVLECTLIKKYRPRYNVLMKDDKSYPYIKVTVSEEWPRVFQTRRVVQDGSLYFGPFAGSASAWRTLEALDRIFPYRTCDKPIDGKDSKPCLQYHIKRCLGPCAGLADPEEYRAMIQQVVLFLEGKQEQIIQQIRGKMEAAADRLEFERAAYLRDQATALENIVQRQKVVSTRGENQDVLGFARTEHDACVQAFFIREGKLLGSRPFLLQGAREVPAAEILTSFLKQFYADTDDIPPRLLLQCDVEDRQVITTWLSQRRGGRVELQVPQRGQKRELIEMASRNAVETLEQMRLKLLSDEDKARTALTELQERLGLPTWPWRIECYDISNIQGSFAVGSMVVFENGMPNKQSYRRFRIKTVEGSDDFAMMREVLTRRFHRAEADTSEDARPEGEGWAARPDLLLVDGGKGQLSAALDVLRDLGVTDVPAAGLAKQQEEVFLPGRPDSVMLPRDSQGLFLLQRVRDEAHRFAITYHRHVRSQAAIASPLDGIKGIGPKRRKALLRHFGSAGRIREASLEELLAIPGITRPLAEQLRAEL